MPKDVSATEVSVEWALETVTLLERRLARFFELVDENVCARLNPKISPAQVLLLMRMPASGCLIKELTIIGAYIGSNVSYNVKVLEQAGYISYWMQESDRRTRFVMRTDKGNEVYRIFESALAYNNKGREVVRILAIEREVSRGIE